MIGGATVCADTIPEADVLFLTQVVGDFKCTKFLPPDETDFRLETRSEEHQDGETSYRFEVWRRLASRPEGTS